MPWITILYNASSQQDQVLSHIDSLDSQGKIPSTFPTKGITQLYNDMLLFDIALNWLTALGKPHSKKYAFTGFQFQLGLPNALLDKWDHNAH